MKNVYTLTREFVRRHKEALVVGGVASLLIYTQTRGILKMNEFLKENDLLEKYYELDQF